MNIFKEAGKQKVRFNSTKGLLTIEDLWDIPLTSKTSSSLDSIAVELHNKLKTATTSFVSATLPENEITVLALDVVKSIIETRLEEIKERETEVERKQVRKKIKRLIDNKKDDSLANKSLEELQSMLDET